MEGEVLAFWIFVVLTVVLLVASVRVANSMSALSFFDSAATSARPAQASTS